jgi:pimeloyl-ACP methyl ester carboxylesterase
MLDDYSGLHLLGQDSARRYSPAAFQRIAELRAPTLVVVGEHDVPDMQAIADALAAQIPGAHKRVLAGVGHLGNLEDPQSFNRIIMEWLP